MCMKLSMKQCHSRSCLDTDGGLSVPQRVAEAAEVSPGNRGVAGMSLPTLTVLAMGLLMAPLIQALHLVIWGEGVPMKTADVLAVLAGCVSQSVGDPLLVLSTTEMWTAPQELGYIFSVISL